CLREWQQQERGISKGVRAAPCAGHAGFTCRAAAGLPPRPAGPACPGRDRGNPERPAGLRDRTRAAPGVMKPLHLDVLPRLGLVRHCYVETRRRKVTAGGGRDWLGGGVHAPPPPPPAGGSPGLRAAPPAPAAAPGTRRR